MSSIQEITYIPSVTCYAFHNSHKDIRLIIGPVGSGKSTACIEELIMMAALQKPDKYGKRSSRWLIVRETYPQLRNTTFESFRIWLKPNDITVRYTESAPMRIRWKDKLEDGTQMNAEFIFMAVSKPQDYENLKSLELTGAFINECGALDYSVVTTVLSRLGRYPAPVDAVDPKDPITRVALIMDTNPPDEDSWVAEKEKNTPSTWDVFHQPGAVIVDPSSDLGYSLNPLGENFDYIGVGPVAYYLDKITSMTKEQIKVLFLGEYGVTSHGKAIYRRQWVDDYHTSKARLRAIKSQPILLSWDWGRGGEACVVGQQTENKQLRVLKEFSMDHIGLEDFAKNFVKPYLLKHFKNHKIESVGDPTGLGTSGQAKDNLCYFDILNNPKNGVFKDWFITRPAKHNSTELRLNAVRHFLTEKTPAGAPMFQLNRDCTVLRKGFNAAYCYERKQVTGEAQFRDVPTKGPASHPHDALQYLCLEIHPNYEKLVKHTEFVTRRVIQNPITNY